MSKRRPPLEKVIGERLSVINGTAPPNQTDRAEFVCITERHGRRHLRLAQISQVVMDAGQIGGPWFVRCDGQQLPVSEANARIIMRLLGLSMEAGH